MMWIWRDNNYLKTAILASGECVNSHVHQLKYSWYIQSSVELYSTPTIQGLVNTSSSIQLTQICFFTSWKCTSLQDTIKWYILDCTPSFLHLNFIQSLPSCYDTSGRQPTPTVFITKSWWIQPTLRTCTDCTEHEAINFFSELSLDLTEHIIRHSWASLHPLMTLQLSASSNDWRHVSPLMHRIIESGWCPIWWNTTTL